MAPEQHSWASTIRTSHTEGRTAMPVCACGQDLDICLGTHCPRCGTSLLAHAA
jgi:hypothetical protein